MIVRSITLGDNAIEAFLDDSPTARELRDRLPVTVDLSDYNGVEKTGAIDALPVDDVPAGAARIDIVGR